MSNENSENVYLALLRGEGNHSRYKNSNLVIIDRLSKTAVERSSKNISPPTNLNPNYSQAYATPYSNNKAKRRKKDSVDPTILQKILSSNG